LFHVPPRLIASRMNVKSPTAPAPQISDLVPLVRALARGRLSDVKAAQASPPIGVRTFKKRLSQLLNEATSGHVTVVEAGTGGSVLLIGTDALAEALMSLENSREMTFGAALDSLPHPPSELPSLTLGGNVPTLHIEQSEL